MTKRKTKKTGFVFCVRQNYIWTSYLGDSGAEKEEAQGVVNSALSLDAKAYINLESGDFERVKKPREDKKSKCLWRIPSAASIMNNFGVVRREKGRFRTCEKICKRTLSVFPRIHGVDELRRF